MNIVTYAAQNMKPFQDQAFHSVDSLILSCVVYMHFPRVNPALCDWDGVPLPALFHTEDFDTIFEHVYDAPASKELLTALVASPRFREIRVKGYVQQSDRSTEKQFAAMTFDLPDGSSYISFRGTDATIVGWKEDFNMAFQYPVPSQAEAADYLNEAARHCRGKLYVGGHSKGGNLAVYAAANCRPDVSARLARVFSHDGPGFLEQALQSEAFRQVLPKIEKTLPQSSMIGMLLEHQENYKIVKSSSISIWQHNPFSWEINGDDFSYRSELTGDARYLNATLNQWIRAMSAEERAQLVDTIYGLIDLDNIATFAQLRAEWQTSFPEIFRSFSGLSPQNKAFLLQMLKELASMGIKNFPELFE